MPRRKIANWTPIREMWRNRFTGKTAEEVEVWAMTLAQLHAEEEVVAFEREGTVAEEAMESVVEEAAKIAFGKMHAVAAREAVEVVAKEAAMAALCEIRDKAAMASLEAVAKEQAKVAMRELRQGAVAREASTKMYMDDAVAEEDRVADAAEVASMWELIDGTRRRWRTAMMRRRRRRSMTPSSVLQRRPSTWHWLTTRQSCGECCGGAPCSRGGHPRDIDLEKP
jgi:hypothetical protein